MQRQFPGSFLPFGKEQIIESAAPHFRPVAAVSGRLDYIETIRQWRRRFGEPQPAARRCSRPGSCPAG